MIVLPQLFMLSVIAAAGALLRKKGVMGDPVLKGISDIVTLITNPALLLMITQQAYTPVVLTNFLHVLWMSSAVMAIGMVAVYVCCRGMSEKVRPILAMLAAMPNSGFMGLPVIQAVYGDQGTLYLAAVIVAFNLVVWTIGVALLDRRAFSLKKLLNPGFVSALAGMALFFLRIDLPSLVDAPLSTLGTLNTPLAMLILGGRMTNITYRKLIDWKTTLVVAVKLIGLPLFALGLSRIVSMDPVAAGALVISSAMPSAIMSQMLAELYDRDAVFAAQEIALTSLLCVVTIPLVVMLLGV
jgi:predicted permease